MLRLPATMCLVSSDLGRIDHFDQVADRVRRWLEKVSATV
jgi:hypothetical protein